MKITLALCGYALLAGMLTCSPLLLAADLSTASMRYLYLGKRYPEPPPLSLLEKTPEDEGIQGARISNDSNNLTGSMLDINFELAEAIVPEQGDIVAEAHAQLAIGHTYIIADLEADDLLSVADLPEAHDAILLNIRAQDDALRTHDCRANVFHMIPDRAMRADALAQYLIWKKWKRWFLVTGKKPGDLAYAAAVKRAAKRFGAKIVEERSYQLETGSSRAATGNQQIQTQMPMLTRGVPEHDVVFVADEEESFGLYLPYRTSDPRPVVGTYGLEATAWHRSYEQFASRSLQSSFRELVGRYMTERDYLAWLSVKLFGEAMLRAPARDRDAIRAFITSPDLNLAGYKGKPMNFRAWNQQLRQPILLSWAGALVAIAPIEGFLHPQYYTDTLGFDKPDSACNLSNTE